MDSSVGQTRVVRQCAPLINICTRARYACQLTRNIVSFISPLLCEISQMVTEHHPVCSKHSLMLLVPPCFPPEHIFQGVPRPDQFFANLLCKTHPIDQYQGILIGQNFLLSP